MIPLNDREHYLKVCETMRKTNIKQMLKLSKEPDPDGRYLLHEELGRAMPSEKVISELISFDSKRVSNINNEGSNSIHVACQYIKSIEPSIFLTLLDIYPEGCAVVNNYGLLPIHKAVMNNCESKSSIRSLKMILGNYPEGLRIQNNQGQLPIHLALSIPKNPKTLVINILIESYPDCLKIQDKFGHLPLHKICANKGATVDIILLILNSFRQGASYADINGMTPLHWLVSRDNPNVESIKELLKVFPMAVHISDGHNRKPIDIQKLRKSPCPMTCFLLLDKQREILNGKYDERVYEVHEILGENSRPPTRDASVVEDQE